MTKKTQLPLWQQPANFWLGGAFVAEGLLGAIVLMMPNGACNKILGSSIGCPLPLWFIFLSCILAFILTTLLAYLLGLGATAKEK